jgi:hypothetical protein
MFGGFFYAYNLNKTHQNSLITNNILSRIYSFSELLDIHIGIDIGCSFVARMSDDFVESYCICTGITHRSGRRYPSTCFCISWATPGFCIRVLSEAAEPLKRSRKRSIFYAVAWNINQPSLTENWHTPPCFSTI